eukprot:753231-Pyramimonas_sp.AAC.2
MQRNLRNSSAGVGNSPTHGAPRVGAALVGGGTRRTPRGRDVSARPRTRGCDVVMGFDWRQGSVAVLQTSGCDDAVPAIVRAEATLRRAAMVVVPEAASECLACATSPDTFRAQEHDIFICAI